MAWTVKFNKTLKSFCIYDNTGKLYKGFFNTEESAENYLILNYNKLF